MPTSVTPPLPQGLDGAVVLSNSVFLADRLRLAAALDPAAPAATAAAGGHPTQGHGSQSAAAVAAAGGGAGNNRGRGRVMIVKAYLGRTTQVRRAAAAERPGCRAAAAVWE